MHEPVELAEPDEPTLRRLLRSMPQQPQLRAWLEAKLAGDTPLPLDEALLLTLLNNHTAWSGAQRVVAALVLQSQSLAADSAQLAARDLAEIVEGDAEASTQRAKRTLRKAGGSVRRAAAGVALISLLLWAFAYPAVGVRGEVALLAIAVALLTYGVELSGAAMLAETGVHALLRAVAATGLARLDAPGGVGALAAATLDKQAIVRQAAIPALARCLPTAADRGAEEFSSETIAILCRLLTEKRVWWSWRSDEDPDVEVVKLRILDALRAVDRGEAIDALIDVQRYDMSERVRETAAALLPVLQARAEQDRIAARLLRPAHPVAGELLRAASGSAEVSAEAAQQLLRPSSASEE